MNTSTSECSSGCESGWTTYLDQLSNSTNPYTHYTHLQGKGANVHDHHDQEDDGDEDLSMVSDASSGPPHLHGGSPPPPPQQDRKQKSKTKETKLKKNKKQHSFCLDDTASSHFLQGNAIPPENYHSFSTAHFEEEISLQKKKMGFFKSPGSLLGRKRQ